VPGQCPQAVPRPWCSEQAAHHAGLASTMRFDKPQCSLSYQESTRTSVPSITGGFKAVDGRGTRQSWLVVDRDQRLVAEAQHTLHLAIVAALSSALTSSLVVARLAHERQVHHRHVRASARGSPIPSSLPFSSAARGQSPYRGAGRGLESWLHAGRGAGAARVLRASVSSDRLVTGIGVDRRHQPAVSMPDQVVRAPWPTARGSWWCTQPFEIDRVVLAEPGFVVHAVDDRQVGIRRPAPRSAPSWRPPSGAPPHEARSR